MKLVILVCLVAVWACSDRGADPASGRSPSSSAQSGERASLAGTVLDAQSGDPVPGARVRAPSGAETTSDAQGRFLIEGLEPGLTGDLRARTEDGREAVSPLRPLKPGRLEVVLRVRAP